MWDNFVGLSIVQQPTARPGAPRLGWPGGCPTAPPMACPRHVAPPHPAVLAHVSRGASRFSCARPARGGAHVGKAVPCSLGGPREAVSGCLREAAGAKLRRADPPGHRNTCRQHPRRSAGTRAGCGRTQHMAPDCLSREMAAQRRQCRPGPACHPQQAPGTKVSDSSSTAQGTVVTRQCVPVGAHCARSGPMAPCQHTGAAGAAPAPPAWGPPVL